MHQPQPGCGSPASRIADHRRDDEAAAGAVAGDRDAAGPDAARQQKAVAGERVVDRRRERVLGRQPVVERQRRDLGGAAGLGHQMPVAVERADHIAAAVQVEERRVALVARGEGPFGGDAVRRRRLDPDIGGDPVFQAARVDVAAALPVVVGPRPARELCPQRADFLVAHLRLLIRRLPAHRAGIRVAGAGSSRQPLRGFLSCRQPG